MVQSPGWRGIPTANSLLRHVMKLQAETETEVNKSDMSRSPCLFPRHPHRWFQPLTYQEIVTQFFFCQSSFPLVGAEENSTLCKGSFNKCAKMFLFKVIHPHDLYLESTEPSNRNPHRARPETKGHAATCRFGTHFPFLKIAIAPYNELENAQPQQPAGDMAIKM